MPSAEINSALREHERTTEDWLWARLASTLHEWTERFNLEFKLEIPVPAIQVEAIRYRTLGTYRSGRNGFALKDEITINARHAGQALSEVLTTLLHELLHAWQEVYGRPGRGNYHNKEFRAKAGSLGLVVNERGETYVMPGRFTEILHRYGIDATTTPPAPLASPTFVGPGSKLKKWSCGCTNVRAAVELEAVCARCGEWFVRV